MNPYERRQVRRLIRFVTDSTTMRIVAVTGPRQTGKTTIALQACRLLEKSGYPYWHLAMDDPTAAKLPLPGPGTGMEAIATHAAPDEQWLVALWESARRKAFRADPGLILVLDEIQVIPRWSNIVKGLWDGDRRTQCPLHVVILGSAPWHMLTGLNESLAGRFEPLAVTHWSFHEMAAAMDLTLDEYLFFGGYPGTLSERPEPTRLDAWREYVVRAIITPTIGRAWSGWPVSGNRP